MKNFNHRHDIHADLKLVQELQERLTSLGVGPEEVRRVTAAIQAASHARHHLAAIVDSAEDAIISKNLDGIIESWNPGAERIFGYTAPEMIGQPILRLLPKDLEEEELSILGRLRAGEFIRGFATVRQRKDGSLVPVSLTISPVRDHQGRIIGASKIARDISAERTSQAEQNALIERLQKALTEIKTLRGMLPICMHCKKIRDDQGFWQQIESYLHKHSEAKFSHSICPTCVKEHYGSLQADEPGTV